MTSKQTLLITGSTGMVGSAMLRKLQNNNIYQILSPTRQELDLRNQSAVMNYFEKHKPHFVCHLAAIVGGIHANNNFPAKFIYENTQMHCNVIYASQVYGAKKVLFPGSACTYPKMASQPIHENSFLDGLIEPTNLAYAAAKINGVVMCQAYAKQHQLPVVIPMPTNAYGVGDNFDPNASHVIPALMKRFHEAKISKLKEVILWGSGKPLREFIYVDDLADALLFLLEKYNSNDIINIGTMQEISILDLAKKVAEVVNYSGKITTDTSKPDGAPRKCLDSNKLFSLGWQPSITLDEGLKKMYEHHFSN